MTVTYVWPHVPTTRYVIMGDDGEEYEYVTDFTCNITEDFHKKLEEAMCFDINYSIYELWNDFEFINPFAQKVGYSYYGYDQSYKGVFLIVECETWIP